MTDPQPSPRPATPNGTVLDELFRYPFMSALVERRTRRLARGLSVEVGPIRHVSENDPAPLTALEEAILVTAVTGITGVTMHDGPLKKPDGRDEIGTPFLHIAGRAAGSPDNCQATHFFLINDDGIFLLRHPTGREALEGLGTLPPRWADWSEEDWVRAAEECKVRVSDRRLEFPREWPYYLGWNAQLSNVAGTTVLFPVVDCTWQYINALLILASEPAGKRPLLVDDWRSFRPRGLVEWIAKIGGLVGLSERIPYHPIGGLKWIRNGFVSPDNPGPLGFGHTLRTDHGAFLHLQNLTLLGEAMGLGGWIHASVFPPYVFHRDEEKGWHGLGFRFQEPKDLSPTPPVPASQPNPVGIDGILEGLCPPYVASMNEAVDRVLEMKYGAEAGAYGDEVVFSRAYRDPERARAYLRAATRIGPEQVAYVKDVCNYIYDTYGRFPAHVDAFYTPGLFLQFSHLEIEYYERQFDPALYAGQAAHDARWHGR